MTTIEELTSQVETEIMPIWREHLAADCVCGWSLGHDTGPFINRCDPFCNRQYDIVQAAVPRGVEAAGAFLAANPQAWEWGSDFAAETVHESVSEVVASELYERLHALIEEATGPLVPPDGMICENEGNHPCPVPAVATWHLTESQSAANITFVCAACAVKGVQETLAGDTWDAFELRPLVEGAA